jgi:hypothetical protein
MQLVWGSVSCLLARHSIGCLIITHVGGSESYGLERAMHFGKGEFRSKTK